MTRFENTGSYLREPSISEEALANRIKSLVERLKVGKYTEISQTFSFDESSLYDREQALALKEVKAALRHELSGSVEVQLKINPRWDTVEARQLQFPLPGTREMKGILEFDTDEYHAHIEDSTEDIFRRSDVAVSTVDSLLTSLGFSSRVDLTNYTTLKTALTSTLVPDSVLKLHQRQTLYENDIDDQMTVSVELDRRDEFTPEEILQQTELKIMTDVGNSKFVRIITVTEGNHGSSISALEISRDLETGKKHTNTPALDYEYLEKLLKQLDNLVSMTPA